MTSHTSKPAGQSQCDKILRHLQANAGDWIGMPQLVRISGSYNIHSRIADLRKRGHQISHKNERRNGEVHSYYRLTSQP